MLTLCNAWYCLSVVAYVVNHFGYATLGKTLGVLLLVGGSVSTMSTLLIFWARNRADDGIDARYVFLAPNSFSQFILALFSSSVTFLPGSCAVLVLTFASGAFLVWYSLRDGCRVRRTCCFNSHP